MKAKETQHQLEERPPECCTYCGEEKSFLMVKPAAYSYKGQMNVNVNLTKKTLWICFECLSMDLDALGHNVDIQEYDEV